MFYSRVEDNNVQDKTKFQNLIVMCHIKNTRPHNMTIIHSSKTHKLHF